MFLGDTKAEYVANFIKACRRDEDSPYYVCISLCSGGVTVSCGMGPCALYRADLPCRTDASLEQIGEECYYAERKEEVCQMLFNGRGKDILSRLSVRDEVFQHLYSVLINQGDEALEKEVRTIVERS